MKVEFDPLQVGDANFVEPVEVLMIEISEDVSLKVKDMDMVDYAEKVKVVYPNVEESL